MAEYQINMFKDIGHMEIQNAQFSANHGPNYSQNTINHHHNTTVNDNSRHRTDYGGYNNFGQHAQGGGQINNYGPPPPTNYDPHRQYSNNTAKFGIYNRTAPVSYNDNFDGNYQPPYRGQVSPYNQPKRDYSGAMQSSANQGPNKTVPRPKMRSPNRSRKEFYENSPEFRKEYERMNPKMQAHLQSLGYDPDAEDSLNEDMANVSLDDPVPGMSPCSYFGRHTPDPPRKGYSSNPPSSDEEDEVDDGYRPYSTYTHIDNRVITKNINSNNTNTENVVDSYNDNSTRTDIRKNASAQ